VNAQRAAEIQSMLEGVPLPATRRQLLRYAQANDPTAVAELRHLPDEEYRRLDQVGELLTLGPSVPQGGERLPRPESGQPPGGPDYLRAHPSDTGRVRHDAPRDNPPQQAIERASEQQKKQKAEQGG
jgi:Protein of unknown function (DUF2795)